MSSIIQIGFLQIHLYSICICLAMIIGIFLLLRESKKFNIPENFIIDLSLGTIISAIIGARIYYVLFNLQYYSNIIDIFKVWEGGLAIHGGIIGGIIFLIFYTKKHKVNTLRILDMSVVSLVIGQAIGRWGNFFNYEAHGSLTTKTFLESIHIPNFIINGMYINNHYYQPTFLYESIWCFLLFLTLYFYKKRKCTKLGQTTALYLILYSVGRFFIESLRTDSLLLFNFKIAQLVSIIMIIIGITMFVLCYKNKTYQKEE